MRSCKCKHALQNGVYTVGGSLETPVKTSEVYKMLVDYPNLNKVFSSIDECHTLTEQQALQLLQVGPAKDMLPVTRQHAVQGIQHSVNTCNAHCILQICRWEFLAFSGTFKTLLNVHEERDAGRVVFSLIKSSFMKDFEGQWQVDCHLHA